MVYLTVLTCSIGGLKIIPVSSVFTFYELLVLQFFPHSKLLLFFSLEIFPIRFWNILTGQLINGWYKLMGVTVKG